MKHTLTTLLVAIYLTACSTVTPAPTLSIIDTQGTAVAAVWTIVAITQAAVPTLTPTPTPTPPPAAGEIVMAPLPDDGDPNSNEEAYQIPEVVITPDMTVKMILDVARGEFEKNPWKGNLWAKNIHTFGEQGVGSVYLYFETVVDKDGKPGKTDKAYELPVEYRVFIGSQEQLRLRGEERAFFPQMIPRLEKPVEEGGWGVMLDDILWMPSVIHLQGRDLYMLEFTDAGLALGTYDGQSTFPDMQDGAGPKRTTTQMINFARADGQTEDTYNSNLPYYLGAEPWQFVDENGKEQVMLLSEAWAHVGNFINSSLQEGESEEERLDKIQGLFDQIPFGVTCPKNVSK